jgi:trans-4-hydroxy-L-proline dehydratase
MERALIETETYKLYDGKVSIPELRALALYRYMENRSLYLGEGELLVGEKADGPQKAPTVPELCCHTLSDMRIMDARELISFKVSEDALRNQEETVIP